MFYNINSNNQSKIEENKIKSNVHEMEIDQNEFTLIKLSDDKLNILTERSTHNLSINEAPTKFQIEKQTVNFGYDQNKSIDKQIFDDNLINSLVNSFDHKYDNLLGYNYPDQCLIYDNQLFDSNSIKRQKIVHSTIQQPINYSFTNAIEFKNEPFNNELSSNHFKDRHLFSNDILKNHQLSNDQCSRGHTFKFDFKDYSIPQSSFDNKQPEQPKLIKPKSFRRYDQLSDEIKQGIQSLGIRRPTPLQDKILSLTLDNKKDDIFIKAGLYTNKELAFLLSAFTRIDLNYNKPQIIILLPTFELVQQVIELANILVQYSRIQIGSLQREDDITKPIIGSHLFITTAGTMITILNNYAIDISKIKLAIFDEIDLLKNSQIGQAHVKNLKNRLSCQSIIFSSSFSDDAYDYVKTITSIKKLVYSDLLDKHNCFKNILHFYVPSYTKKECYFSLANILRNIIINKILICVISKKAANFVNEKLRELNLITPIILLTSDLSFQERISAIEVFNNNPTAILISIYPLYVNLYLRDLSLIINYDLPYDTIANQTREYNHKLNHLTRQKRPGMVINILDESLIHNKFKLNRRKVLEEFTGIPMIRLLTNSFY